MLRKMSANANVFSPEKCDLLMDLMEIRGVRSRLSLDLCNSNFMLLPDIPRWSILSWADAFPSVAL